MRVQIGYRIISGTRIEIVEHVTDWLEQGWETVGSLSVVDVDASDGPYFYQAMGKYGPLNDRNWKETYFPVDKGNVSLKGRSYPGHISIKDAESLTFKWMANSDRCLSDEKKLIYKNCIESLQNLVVQSKQLWIK